MDETEAIRKEMINEISIDPGSREALEKEYGKVWDTEEVQEVFSIEGFMAPLVIAVHKESGKRGALMFQNIPRFYFDFVEF